MDSSVIQPPKQKKSTILHRSTRKAPAIRNAVVARRLSGQPNSKIAKELGIAVNTVKSITNLTDVDRMTQDGRVGCAELIPKSIKVVDYRLDRNDLNAALAILNPLVLKNEQPGTGKRMAGDVTLNQTLQVLLRSEDPPANQPTIEVKQVTDADTHK